MGRRLGWAAFARLHQSEAADGIAGPEARPEAASVTASPSTAQARAPTAQFHRLRHVLAPEAAMAIAHRSVAAFHMLHAWFRRSRGRLLDRVTDDGQGLARRLDALGYDVMLRPGHGLISHVPTFIRARTAHSIFGPSFTRCSFPDAVAYARRLRNRG